MSGGFRYRSGVLTAGGEPLAPLADAYGTPLYVYDRRVMVERIDEIRGAFDPYPHRLLYSVKANPNLTLLRWFAKQGLGFDIVSGGELERLLSVGVDPAAIFFSGVGKTDSELAAALDHGVWLINVESVGEARRLAALADTRSSERVGISIRINPDVDAVTHPFITTGRLIDKFGVDREELPLLLDLLGSAPQLELQALHMHLGSQIRTVEPYRAGLEVLLEVLDAVRGRGFTPHRLNLGGGFGITQEDIVTPTMADYAAALLPRLADREVELILEPGRYLVGEAGCLLTRVIELKQHAGIEFAVVDAGMNDFLRPALYDVCHPIRPLEPRRGQPRPVDVVGPICETADTFACKLPLPPLKPGDLLAITHTGAYGMSMASTYNTRPLPAEAWITAPGEHELIRRRGSVTELLRAERDRPHQPVPQEES